ncbi:SPFH domain-containing protein [Pseudomonas lini]|uniref:SPFH domain-containing protein n=1 Tax=Pseudomonas lini TaxID=163011 RepID=UPI00345F1308
MQTAKTKNTICLMASWLGGLMLVCLVAGSSFYTVNERELGLVLRNGEVLSEVGPGLGWKLPIVDKVFRISSQNNIFDIAGVHNYTSDLHEFNADVSVVWHVAPGKMADIYTQYNDLQSVELALIKPRVIGQIGLVMSHYKGSQMFDSPDRFIKDSFAAIKMAVGELVVIDSVNFEKLILTDLDRSASSEEAAVEAAAPDAVRR